MKLYFRYGSMNCGKTTLLLQTAYNYEERDMRVFIIKPKLDTKGEDFVVSRLGVKRKVDLLVDNNTNLLDLPKVDCILVDEVQFLKKEQINQLYEFAVVNNIPVICYGLRTDFLNNGFEGSSRLLEIAHSITELKTICRCGKKATCSMRKINGKPTFSGNQIGIDVGEIEYESVCSKCFIEKRRG